MLLCKFYLPLLSLVVEVLEGAGGIRLFALFAGLWSFLVWKKEKHLLDERNYNNVDCTCIYIYLQSFAKILAATIYQYIHISGALWVIK